MNHLVLAICKLSAPYRSLERRSNDTFLDVVHFPLLVELRGTDELAYEYSSRIQNWNGFGSLPNVWKAFLLTLAMKGSGPWSWATNAGVSVSEGRLTISTTNCESYYHRPLEASEFIETHQDSLSKLSGKAYRFTLNLIKNFIGPWCLRDHVTTIEFQNSGRVCFVTRESESYYYPNR